MGYAVVHMKKIKSTGVKGIQIHNRREKESRTNPDIDKTKSNENYDVLSCDNYNQRIKGIVGEFATETKTVRKDAVVCCSFIVTSDEKTMKAMDESTQQQFFKNSYSFFCNRYGAENVVYATVHKDEKTPHMHLGVVPIDKGNRLSAKNIFNRKELVSLQTAFARDVGQIYGLERGQEGSTQKHLSEERFKLEKTKELNEGLQRTQDEMREIVHNHLDVLQETRKDIATLDTQKKSLNHEINDLQATLSRLNDISAEFEDIKRIKAKKALLGGINVPKDDFEFLMDLAKKATLQDKKIKNLESALESINHNYNQVATHYNDLQDKSVRKKLAQIEKEMHVKKQLERLKKLESFVSKMGKTNDFERFARCHKNARQQKQEL